MYPSPFTLDVLYFLVALLGDIAGYAAGALITLAFIDGLISVVQIMRR